MKQLLLFITVIILFASQLQPQSLENFDEYFTDQTMRIDYFHIGDAIEEFITIDKVYQYGTWAGSRVNLLDNFNNGRYYVKIYDAESRELIFSKGFDSYFGEYKTSEDAIDRIKANLPRNSFDSISQKRNNLFD